jgi:hypothetical protein
MSTVDIFQGPLGAYGKVRVQAKAVWRGPSYLYWITEEEDENHVSQGSPIFQLEVRHKQPKDHVESRTVLGVWHWGDDVQRHALLRAVQWDGRTVRRIVQKNEPYSLIIAARFVLIPMAQLRDWVAQFSDVAIPFGPQKGIVTEIRRLRIELDYDNRASERIWDVDDPTCVELNHRWKSIWNDMTVALETQPVITQIDENYKVQRLEYQFDFEAYEPRRITPSAEF